MTTSIFTVAANLTTADLTPEMNNDWRLNWEKQLNNHETAAPSLPPRPGAEDFVLYETVLLNFVKTAAELGAWSAERINHYPYDPHLPGYARPGASVFHDDFPEEILGRLKPCEAIVTALEGGPGVRIFTVFSGGDIIGTNRTATPIEGETYKMVEAHGGLLPQGKAEEVEEPTPFITFVFTYEGEQIGWVTASAHPGKRDKTPNVSKYKVGDIVLGENLIQDDFERVLPG